jgi:hypothetical protein
VREDHPVPQLANTEDQEDITNFTEVCLRLPHRGKGARSSKEIEHRRSVRWVLASYALTCPLFIILATCLPLRNHVHDFYLEPQLKVLRWTDDRAAEEITYYLRECGCDGHDDARWSGIVFVPT